MFAYRYSRDISEVSEAKAKRSARIYSGKWKPTQTWSKHDELLTRCKYNVTNNNKIEVKFSSSLIIILIMQGPNLEILATSKI